MADLYASSAENALAVVVDNGWSVAFGLGEKLQDPLQMYLSDIYTISANLAGIPALSMPCGLSDGGLPVGLQLLAPPFAEDRLLQAAYVYEQAAEGRQRKPVLQAHLGDGA